MGKFIFLSFLFHLTLLILFKLDLVNLENSKEKTINVGLLQEKKETKKALTNKINKKDTQKIPKNKKENLKETAKKKPNNKKENLKEAAKKKSKNKVNQKEKKKQVAKKETQKKKTKEQVNKNDFDDLLKNLAEKKLTKDSKDSFDTKLKKLSKKKLTSSSAPGENELNSIEKLLLNQIDENWSRPPGIKISENLIIKIIVSLDISGKVIGLQVHQKTQSDLNKYSTLQPYLDSAIRAIKKASPFEGLRKDRYNKNDG